MHPNYDLKGLARRNLTPPYLSNIAEVTHAAPPQSEDAQRLLILALDGLAHVLSRSKDVWDPFTAADLWCAAAVSPGSGVGDMALDVLWDTLQPKDGENLYKRMVEGKYRGRVDDITIIVCPL
ncbi:Protein serine/threonine phosphatase 2C [Mycena venus]|uniref:Protein serine/threonine phosphatase 2C n=1 Tax=Mycena venus TaxID=2733690 RepID=A0A8H7CPC0_9AGAR|nr:Protein serine/threonine phosphatase 2C [Mycena venus]